MQGELSRQLDTEPELQESVEGIVGGTTDIYAATDHILGNVGLVRT
ncbi:MAG: hypothetical protein GY713_00125 [Actinomycetia bacterium]|nr:hypothetical protein [Actinomycetes bacterium]